MTRQITSIEPSQHLPNRKSMRPDRIAWLIALLVYTYLLIAPNEWLPPWLRAAAGHPITEMFTWGKLAHAGAYAVLTITLFWLPVTEKVFWTGVVVLLIHSTATEYVQTFTGRTGRLLDVLIDQFGIVLGLCLGALWERFRRG